MGKIGNGGTTRKGSCSFWGTYGIGQDICEICREYKTSLYVYSRSTGVDVSNSQSVRRVLSEIFDKEGRIDWIVNTAGILDKQPLANMSYEAGTSKH